MERKEKINKIIDFVSFYPQSTASRSITRRILKRGHHEFSQELAFELEEGLLKTHEEEVNLCYDLVK